MSGRVAVSWSLEARADLRSIERGTALEILHYLDRYLLSRAGVQKRTTAIEITGIRDGRMLIGKGQN